MFQVAAIDDSAEFRLGIRMNAKMDQGKIQKFSAPNIVGVPLFKQTFFAGRFCSPNTDHVTIPGHLSLCRVQ